MSHIMGNIPIEILIIFLVGILIYYFLKNYNKKKSIHKEEFFEWIEGMNGMEFEKYLEKLFVALDYKVVRTPGSRDMGADLILKSQSKVIAVEAKRWTGSIGNSVIRSIAGGMQYHHANEGWVITNSEFTELAYKQAKASGIKLIDGHNLKKIQEDAYQNLTKQEPSKKGLEKMWTTQGVSLLSAISIIAVIISSTTNHS